MATRSLIDILSCHNYTHFCCGSLPYKEAQSALSFVFEHSKIIPFWPELPGISEAEQIINRAEGVLTEGWNGYAPSEALGLYAIRHELHLRGAHLPLLKCQVTGPLTFVEYSQALHLSWDQAFEIATDNCLKQIEWQMAFFSGLADHLLFVIDDPALVNWEQLGEVKQAKLSEAYSRLYVSVSERNCYLGLHSCSAFNREILSLPIEFYSFDAMPLVGLKRNILSEDAAWQGALKRGIVMAPGVFPAVEDSNFQESIERGLLYFESLQNQSAACLRDRAQIILAANCGHATAREEWVEMLYA